MCSMKTAIEFQIGEQLLEEYLNVPIGADGHCDDDEQYDLYMANFVSVA